MEKILFAMVGACTADGKSAGYVSQGMCVPLAATEGARSVIEEMGEDVVADWLQACDLREPGAGGLWVLELEIENVDKENNPFTMADYQFDITDSSWRPPTVEELEGVIAKQMHRAQRRDKSAPKPPGTAAWTFIGALV